MQKCQQIEAYIIINPQIRTRKQGKRKLPSHCNQAAQGNNLQAPKPIMINKPPQQKNTTLHVLYIYTCFKEL
jgi:hypothetical protein